MRKLTLSLTTYFILLLLEAGCSNQNSNQRDELTEEENPTMSKSDEISEIGEMFDYRFERFISANGPNEMSRVYVENVTEDAVWMPPGIPPVRGREATRSWVENFFSNFELIVEAHQYEEPVIGDGVAYRRFTATGRYVLKETGEEIEFDQKYMDYLKKVDGKWYLSGHTWSSNNTKPSIWDPHHPLFDKTVPHPL